MNRQSKHQRKRFDVLAQQLPVGVYATDRSGRFVYVNERWCELAGLQPEQAHGESWACVVHPEDLERVVAEWRRSRVEQRDYSLEYRYVRPDGSASWVWCRAVELCDDDGEVTGYLGTCSDTVVTPTVDRAQEAAVHPGHRHPDRRLLEGGAEAVLGRTQRVLGAPALGDVLDLRDEVERLAVGLARAGRELGTRASSSRPPASARSPTRTTSRATSAGWRRCSPARSPTTARRSATSTRTGTWCRWT